MMTDRLRGWRAPDSLVQMAGISSKNRFTDGLEAEQGRGISIKATGLSLYFDLPQDKAPQPPGAEEEEGQALEGFLLNLIDSPGHVDFSSEVNSRLMIREIPERASCSSIGLLT